MPVPSDASLSHRLIAWIVALSLLAVTSLAGMSFWAALQIDEASLARQSGFVSFALNEQVEQLPIQQASSTIWNDAVLQAKAGNAEWMSQNLTTWMQGYFGHNRDYVLDEQNRPVHLVVDGNVVDASFLQRDETVIGPLIADLRNRMRTASAGLSDSTSAVANLKAETVALLDGRPMIVSVRPIVPNSDSLTQSPGTEYLHVAVRYIDQSLLDQIGKKFSLSDIRLSAHAASSFWTAQLPVRDPSGTPIAYVTWERYRPGINLLQQTTPAVLGVVIAAFGLLGFLLWRLRGAAQKVRESEAQTRFLAFHDTLTGLPNRALFDDRLDRALAVSRRDQSRLALICLDMDRFKNVNDTLGHPAGDELVRLAAGRIAECVRASDTVARIGGDEFAVIQVGVRDERDAEALAERIGAALARPFKLFEDMAFVTASMGIAICHAGGTTRADLLREADIALYEAKAKGRARYQVFGGDMDDIVRRKRAIEHDLRAALESGDEIQVVYQPLFDGHGKEVVGAEALVRWNHPVHGLLPPSVFVGIAEERGLIEALGETVLRKACAFAVTAGLARIAVNVSPVQFRNDRIVPKVLAVLKDTHLPAGCLELEITEGMLLEKLAVTDGAFESLRAAGVRIVLDDFGTGYSSMSYLRRYRVDKLKIDRSFVNELGVSAEADAIVEAMIRLARALRIEVTAEGVETVEQRDRLTALGCNEMQGFLLSRPLTAEQFIAMQARSAPDKRIA